MIHGTVRRWATPPPRKLPAVPLVLFAVLAVAGVLWILALRQTAIVGSIVEGGRSLAELRAWYAGDPATVLHPAAYGGVVVILLALVGLVTSVSRDGLGLRLAYLGVSIAGVVLSVGPSLPVPVYEGLHGWLPGLHYIRNLSRFRVLTSVGTAVLLGYGSAWVAARFPERARSAVGWLLAGVVLAAVAPRHGIALTRFADNPVFDRFARDARRVLYVPVTRGDSPASAATSTTTRTRVPMLNGYSPRPSKSYQREVLAPLASLATGELGDREHALLRRLGVTHVVLDRMRLAAVSFSASFVRDRLRASPALEGEPSWDPLWVFRVTDRPPGEAATVTSPVGLFVPAESANRATGQPAADPTMPRGRGVIGRPGRDSSGVMMSRRFWLPLGRYRLTARGRGAGLSMDVLTGASGPALRTAWAGVVPGDLSVTFVLPATGAVDLRVQWDGQEAALDAAEVVFAERPQPEWTLEVEALRHRAYEREDALASGGWAAFADPVWSPRGGIVDGPARRYPAGRFRLFLRARLLKSLEGPVLVLAVQEPAGATLARRAIRGAELASDGYREVGLDFETDRPTVLEFPMDYIGGTGVYLDRLRIVPR